MIGVSDPEQFFAPPPDPNAQPMDPMVQATMATLQQKSEQSQAEGQVKLAALQQKGQQDAAEHQAKLTEQDVRTLWGAVVRLVEGPRTNVQTRKRTGPKQTPKKIRAPETDVTPE